MNHARINLLFGLVSLAATGAALASILVPHDWEYALDASSIAAHEKTDFQMRRFESLAYARVSPLPGLTPAFALAHPGALAEMVAAQSPVGHGRKEHTASSDMHFENSTTHSPESDMHSSESLTHTKTTDDHELPSDTHFVNSDEHNSTSDTHTDASFSHTVTTDEHESNSDAHTVDSDSHYDNSDDHFSTSNSHYVASDEHYENSGEHSSNTDTHTPTSTSHFDGSDQHPTDSSTHTSVSQSSTGDPGDGEMDCDDCFFGYGTSTGVGYIAFPYSHLISGAENAFSTNCDHPLDVLYKIVPGCTPHPAMLTGMLRLELVSGDPNTVHFSRGPSQVQYTLGSNIPISVGPHQGCGGCSWHWGYDEFTVRPLKPGTLRLRVVVDPDPGPGGVGPPITDSLTIIIPPFREHEIIYKTFIQCQAVVNPSPLPTCCSYFAGDNRYLSYTQGQAFGSNELGSRTAQRVRVTVDPDKPGIVLGSLQQQFGMSKGYAVGSIWSPNPSAPCEFELAPGAMPSHTDTQTSSISFQELTPPPAAVGERIRRFQILVSAADPLELSSYICPIVVDIKFDIKECGGSAWYRLQAGERTQYPAHEMYLNGSHHTLTYTPNDPDDSTYLCAPNTPINMSEWWILGED